MRSSLTQTFPEINACVRLNSEAHLTQEATQEAAQEATQEAAQKAAQHACTGKRELEMKFVYSRHKLLISLTDWLRQIRNTASGYIEQLGLP